MHVHLLSNASLDSFPDNRMSDFKNVLTNPIKFDSDDWRVCLSEIHIPYMFENITKADGFFEWFEYDLSQKKLILEASTTDDLKAHNCSILLTDENLFKVKIPDGYVLELESAQCGLPKTIFGDTDRVFIGEETNDTHITGKITLYSVGSKLNRSEIPSGYYENVRDVIAAVNFELTEFTFEQNYVVCQLKKPIVLRFSEQIANILGFRKHSIQKTKNRAVYVPDPFPGLNCILVYTDFIKESLVGDTSAPLLRMLPMHRGKRGDYVSYECFPLQFKEVLSKEISSIRIVLRDDSGRELPFMNTGRVVLTLEFREKWNTTYTLH